MVQCSHPIRIPPEHTGGASDSRWLRRSPDRSRPGWLAGRAVVSGATAISAHRGGSEHAPKGTYEAYQSALATGAEYVEFDIRRTADGTLVSYHPARVARHRAVAAVSYDQLRRLAGYQVPRMTEALPMLAGRAAAHLDLKQADCAEEVVTMAAGIVGPASLLVTTGDDPLAAALGRRFPAVPIGVTIGGDLAQAARFAAGRLRTPGLSRLEPVLAAGSGWAVVHRRLARTGVLTECRRRGLKTAVWTVNADREIAHWLASPDVDVLITDRPGHAMALRARLGPCGQSRSGPAR
jgi:glycerophosphoryl diester phosphodiesterase